MGKKGHSEIRNKDVRSLMYQKLKKEKEKTKKKQKLENKDKPKQTPKTIENCRVIDETYVNNLNDDQELQLDLRTDEISRHLVGRTPDPNQQANDADQDNDEQKIDEFESKLDKKETNDTDNELSDEDTDEEEASKEPKILITTHDMTISFKTYKLCRELARILPNANYFYRKNVRLSKVIPEAIKRNYSAMIVINEDRKVPNGMMITLLPEGPTMNFKLTNVILSDELKDGGVHQFTKHKPEIMLNNFNTRLGLQIGRSFAALFPHDPQYEGRHVITFHNQRDFVFFRHHRYIFRNEKKVGLLELGPKFTLKLRSLQKGTFDSKFGEYEWVHKPEMNSVIELQDDSEFTGHLSDAGPTKLVVVDFSATWCGPCTMIAPYFKQLSVQFPNAMFLKVDVDKCPGTAAANNVTAMPTFVFYRNRVVIDRLRGANKTELENKIKQLIQAVETSNNSTESNGTPAPGTDGEFIDLVGMINKSQSECLNQSDDHTWEHCLTPSTTTFLQSDVDEQLLLHISFQQAVKINSLVIQGPEDNGPKDVKIFINQTRTLDFDSAEKNQALHSFELKPEDLKDNTLIKLRFVKFQNVQSITLFFVNNQSSSETTVVNYLKFNGAPLSVTNMSDFKRVSGQAGEAHG